MARLAGNSHSCPTGSDHCPHYFFEQHRRTLKIDFQYCFDRDLAKRNCRIDKQKMTEKARYVQYGWLQSLKAQRVEY